MSLFKKILIANRGEIACRIIKTARKMGITTVAVYSEIGAASLHVQLADEAYLLGAAPSTSSYLNIDKIIEIAHACKAEAIHPGYGFLSEKAEFAKACEKNHIIFIGPDSSAIQTMGEKHLAKSIMQRNHIPVLPDYFSDAQHETDLFRAAERIGFPILIKAVAGGGGKGLRLVNKPEDFQHALVSAKREAKASFHDDRVLLEKYLPSSRHIEVQIIADHHNNVVHLFERDCSIQRKHQKVVEEAPAPHIPAQVKQNMYQAAIQAAKSIEYRNAGTVEFLLSDQNEFYFMEMNTRLQVEHPITEMITGLDIVEWQIRIAANEQLPVTDQSAIRCQGHAIEVRLNAEDPSKDFIPAAGQLQYFKHPELSQLRIDTGYREGDTISIYYDSLIAKLIIHAHDRPSAINALLQNLNNIAIAGITTNLCLLKNILANTDYQAAKINTLFLGLHPALVIQQNNFFIPAIIIAALAWQYYEQQQLKHSPNYEFDIESPWFTRQGWQSNLPATVNLELITHEETIPVMFNYTDNHIQCFLHEKNYELTHLHYKVTDKIIRVFVQIGQQFFSADVFILQNKINVFLKGESFNFTYDLFATQHAQHQNNSNHLRAPMPGTIVEIMVNQGQKVAKGDKLLVIEAMKMEHIIYAPRDGIIQKCHFAIGDSINEGSELLEIRSAQEIAE